MPAVPPALSGRSPPGCPACCKPTYRIVRQPEDRAASVPRGLRRYRCGDAACGWEGLLARAVPTGAAPLRLAGSVVAKAQAAAASMQPAPTPKPAMPARGHRLLSGLVVAVAVAGPMAVIGVSGLELIASPATGRAAAPGESHDGLLLRQGCAWGQPGRQPYRGSTEQALTAAGLPPEVVQQIAAQRQAGRPAGRVEISRDAIRQVDGPGRFNPRSMAMSFGLTLCLH